MEPEIHDAQDHAEASNEGCERPSEWRDHDKRAASDACRVRYLRAGVVGLDIACEVVAGHDGHRSPAEQPTAHGADPIAA
jgi:hypothetical protein